MSVNGFGTERLGDVWSENKQFTRGFLVILKANSPRNKYCSSFVDSLLQTIYSLTLLVE